MYKNRISNAIFLDITSDNRDLTKFFTEKWIKVYDQSEGNYDVKKASRIKTSMLRSDLCNFNDAYIVVRGNITANEKTFTANDIEEPNNTAANATATNNANNNAFGKKNWFLKIMHHLLIAYQKLMV